MHEKKINPRTAKNIFCSRYSPDENNKSEELTRLYSRLTELEGAYGVGPVILQGETLVLYNKHLS